MPRSWAPTPNRPSREEAVRRVGFHPRLVEEAVDHTAEWLTFVGALIVAFVAAATAQWRQRGQLRHDRELRDLEELRALLDECAQAGGAASQAFLQWTNALAYMDPGRRRRWRSPLLRRWRRSQLIALSEDVTVEITDANEVTDLAEREREFTAAAEPIFALYQRVVLRLGLEHPATEAFLAVQGVYAVYLASTDDIEDKELGSRERWDAVREAQGHVRAAHFGFLEACQRLVASRIRER
jgi:hypothetical protein